MVLQLEPNRPIDTCSSQSWLFYTELEALGDDLALDEDTSYLDEVPAPSDTLPGETDQEGTKTQVHLFFM